MKSFLQYLQELASPPLPVKHPLYGKYPRGYGDTDVERETMESDEQTWETSVPKLRAADRRYDYVEDIRARRNDKGNPAPFVVYQSVQEDAR